MRRLLRFAFTWGWILLAPIAVGFALWGYATHRDYQAFVLRHEASTPHNTLDLHALGELRFAALWRDLSLTARPRGMQPAGTLPAIDLFVPAEALRTLDARLPQSGFEYQPGMLKYPDGELRRVNVRYRGDMFYHWALEKRSWRVKTRRSQLYRGMRRFNLIIPKRPALLNNYLSYALAEKMELISPRVQLVTLRLNGENQGIFILTEQIREELLRYRGRLPGDIYNGDLTWKTAFRGIGNRLFTTPVSWDKVAFNSHWAEESTKPLEALIDLMLEAESEENHRALLELLDVSAFARFSAYLTLLQTDHVDDNHNWKLYYDAGRRAFEPLVWDPVGWTDYKARQPRFRADLLRSSIMRRLHRNHRFLAEKDRALRDFFEAGHDRALLALADETIERLGPEIRKDPALVFAVHQQRPHHASAREVAEEIPRLRNFVEETFRQAKKAYFGGLSRVDYDWSPERGELALRIHGRVPVEALELDFEGAPPPPGRSELRFAGGPVRDISGAVTQQGARWRVQLPLLAAVSVEEKSGGPLEWRPGVYRLRFEGGGSQQLWELGARAASGPLPTRRRAAGEADFEAGDFSGNFVVAREAPLPRRVVWEGEVVLEGIHEIRDELFVRAGTRVRLAPGAQVLVRGRMTVDGTPEAPVSFEPLREGQEPWGGLHLQGRGADGSSFRHCRFRDGSGWKEDLLEYSAMFSVHDTRRVEVEHCDFKNGRIVDDMVHTIYAEIRFADSTFHRAYSDALDIDISQAVIERCTFTESGNDAVDLMTSQAVVRDSYFRNSGDKGISIGEQSYLFALNNHVEGNAIGMQSKDGSQAVLYNTTFERNAKALDAYNKNWRYGTGGNIRLYKSLVLDNDAAFTADKRSSIWVYDTAVDGLLAEDGQVALDSTVDRGRQLRPRVSQLWKHPEETDAPEALAAYWSNVDPSRRGAQP